MKNPSNLTKKKIFSEKTLVYTLLTLPAILWLVFFHYLPISGIVLAFKDYKYTKGIFGSDWIGLQNFKFFFESSDAAVILRNTTGYHLLCLLFINLIGGMIVALMLYEIRSRFANKLYQTAMLLPNFVSVTVIAFIVYMFLNPTNIGIINNIIISLGGKSINWYNEAKYWPFIMMFCHMWKSVGMASLYYYAALLSIDTSLFEAAHIDGAGKLKQIWHISVPELLPMACMTTITQLGSLLTASFDMYYQIPMNSGALYPVTDVISTYVYRGIEGGNIGATSAVGLFQSVVGLILILSSNAIIKKISPENAVF